MAGARVCINRLRQPYTGRPGLRCPAARWRFTRTPLSPSSLLPSGKIRNGRENLCFYKTPLPMGSRRALCVNGAIPLEAAMVFYNFSILKIPTTSIAGILSTHFSLPWRYKRGTPPATRYRNFQALRITRQADRTCVTSTQGVAYTPGASWMRAKYIPKIITLSSAFPPPVGAEK
jgi:hypothetical protein